MTGTNPFQPNGTTVMAYQSPPGSLAGCTQIWSSGGTFILAMPSKTWFGPAFTVSGSTYYMAAFCVPGGATTIYFAALKQDATISSRAVFGGGTQAQFNDFGTTGATCSPFSLPNSAVFHMPTLTSSVSAS